MAALFDDTQFPFGSFVVYVKRGSVEVGSFIAERLTVPNPNQNSSHGSAVLQIASVAAWPEPGDWFEEMFPGGGGGNERFRITETFREFVAGDCWRCHVTLEAIK
jgi:hypothetical protein